MRQQIYARRRRCEHNHWGGTGGYIWTDSLCNFPTCCHLDHLQFTDPLVTEVFAHKRSTKANKQWNSYLFWCIFRSMKTSSLTTVFIRETRLWSLNSSMSNEKAITMILFILIASHTSFSYLLMMGHKTTSWNQQFNYCSRGSGEIMTVSLECAVDDMGRHPSEISDTSVTGFNWTGIRYKFPI